MSAGYLAKCARKKKHATQAEAEKHRQGLIKAGTWKSASSNTYFCNQCGGYHAGRVNGSPRGKGRKRAKNTPRYLATQ